VKNPVDLFYNVYGSYQYKIKIDPVILKPSRYGVVPELAAYKKVGVYDSF
jgi:hypothetical protein